ncbi:MAG: hypothetical protein BWY77_01570 [bacterium ADurb.Bin431]|nr:MAG: hypothetical protein BWY77_01570 [bacterium ADurb.Bin431]
MPGTARSPSSGTMRPNAPSTPIPANTTLRATASTAVSTRGCIGISSTATSIRVWASIRFPSPSSIWSTTSASTSDSSTALPIPRSRTALSTGTPSPPMTAVTPRSKASRAPRATPLTPSIPSRSSRSPARPTALLSPPARSGTAGANPPMFSMSSRSTRTRSATAPIQSALTISSRPPAAPCAPASSRSSPIPASPPAPTSASNSPRPTLSISSISTPAIISAPIRAATDRAPPIRSTRECASRWRTPIQPPRPSTCPRRGTISPSFTPSR